jgi:hypothetical protein
MPQGRENMKPRLTALLCVAVWAGVAAEGASAGKVTPSITLSNVTNNTGALTAQAVPTIGDSVNFTTVIPTNVQNPRVEVLCYQNGSLVYGEGGAPTDSFLLGGGGSVWLDHGGGAASCVANLYYFAWKAGQPATVYLATTSFDAAA